MFENIILRTMIIFLMSATLLHEPSIAKADSNVVFDAQQGCSTDDSGTTAKSEKDDSKADSSDSSKGDDIPNKKNIKKIYEVLHGDYGFSAVLIAGIISNWITESQLDPTSNEPGNSGVKTAKAATKGELGIGFGQWSFERHHALVKWAKNKHDGADWWETKVQMDYMVNGDEGYTDTLKQLANDSKDDPVLEAINFHNDWERSADSEDKIRETRGGNAKKVLAYMKANGMDGKKDKEKIKKIGKGNSKSSGASSSDNSNEKETSDDPCEDSGNGDGSSGSGDGSHIGDSTKVNGKPGKTIGRNYKYEDLPKKYQDKIKLPKFKEEYYKGSPFVSFGDKGQCTEFTWAYMNQLWKGKQPSDDGKTTNGNRVHEVYKDKGAKVTKKPTVGYGFSSDPPQAGAADPTVGHTGVVAAVMDDGKWIMASTNLTPDPAPSRTLYYTVIDGTDGDIKFFGGVGNKPKN
ncbi:phage tail tip lysozyme [Staphylococcus shinii]|uniref:phage tail tip lysozyme n=1 Tax=Staphylococcus shinii TaxID=2912228 RepID=UPI003EE88BE0